MTAPQVIMVAWLALSLGVSMSQHGKPRTGKHSFWISLTVVAINVAVLYWGGFFSGGAA
ncbi:hypothetical protein [Massilia sp. CCM 8734]|uniref:hypothetical protein n=1 Tax=Massilia sp. CCM 8734 TaxID=2609283 RepID=UPI0014211B17|nr:hypothetical protein [Massilia sp. CCM 8734]